MSKVKPKPKAKPKPKPDSALPPIECPEESCTPCEPAFVAPELPAPLELVPGVVPELTPEVSVSPPKASARQYPSLYDGTSTTMVAIGVGLLIIAFIQMVLWKIASKAKSDHGYLTRFVTSLVAIIMGIYVADHLIAGPDTSLLSGDERTLVIHFVKDICLMVFAYYFGLKSPVPSDRDE
jgi:hypothetical protein